MEASLKTKPTDNGQAKRVKGVEGGVGPEPELGNNCTSGVICELKNVYF